MVLKLVTPFDKKSQACGHVVICMHGITILGASLVDVALIDDHEQ